MGRQQQAAVRRASGGARLSQPLHPPPGEFTRRFPLHVLPGGFHRIRHYGLFANGGRAENLARAHDLLGIQAPQKESDDAAATADEPLASQLPCPCCGGRMIIIETFERDGTARAPPIRIYTSWRRSRECYVRMILARPTDLRPATGTRVLMPDQRTATLAFQS